MTSTSEGDTLCTFLISSLQEVKGFFGNGEMSTAPGGESYSLAPGTYRCASGGGDCEDTGIRMIYIVNWFGFFFCEEDLECTLDGQSQRSTFTISGTNENVLDLRGFNMINGRMVSTANLVSL